MSEERWRTAPIYTIGEAARLAGVSPRTVRRWLQGDDTAGGSHPPLFGASTDSLLVSFLQLVEIVVAKGFRSRNVSLERVRRAHARAVQQLGVAHPFAELRLRAWGGHILHMIEGDDEESVSLEALDTDGQHTLPGLVQAAMASLDYDDGLAARWYPMGKDAPIVVDPRYASGVPTVPGRNVTISGIQKRFEAGQSIQFIARDLALSPQQVEDVLRYRMQAVA